jgi:hypothetical protein
MIGKLIVAHATTCGMVFGEEEQRQVLGGGQGKSLGGEADFSTAPLTKT